MNKIEELGMEIARLKVVEQNIINEMRVINKPIEDKIHLLCKLEVVRFDIKPLYEEYKELIRDEMINKKEKI